MNEEDETPGFGHDCTLSHPTCTRCALTWAEIVAGPSVPCTPFTPLHSVTNPRYDHDNPTQPT